MVNMFGIYYLLFLDIKCNFNHTSTRGQTPQHAASKDKKKSKEDLVDGADEKMLSDVSHQRMLIFEKKTRKSSNKKFPGDIYRSRGTPITTTPLKIESKKIAMIKNSSHRKWLNVGTTQPSSFRAFQVFFVPHLRLLRYEFNIMLKDQPFNCALISFLRLWWRWCRENRTEILGDLKFLFKIQSSSQMKPLFVICTSDFGTGGGGGGGGGNIANPPIDVFAGIPWLVSVSLSETFPGGGGTGVG